MDVQRVLTLVDELDATMEQAYAGERSRFRSVLLTRSRILAAQLRAEVTNTGGVASEEAVS